MKIAKDEFSIQRHAKSSRISLYCAYGLIMIVSPILVIGGIISIIQDTLPIYLSVLVLVFGVIWGIQLLVMLYTDGTNPFFFDVSNKKKAIWLSEMKWMIISICTLNFMMITLLGYSLFHRKIYNTIVELL
ncbi:MAG: hypothetical protein NC236_01725 [Mycoplasma sp.]|nr:hypothetical protein [Mycoplasma sp.]